MSLPCAPSFSLPKTSLLAFSADFFAGFFPLSPNPSFGATTAVIGSFTKSQSTNPLRLPFPGVHAQEVRSGCERWIVSHAACAVNCRASTIVFGSHAEPPTPQDGEAKVSAGIFRFVVSQIKKLSTTQTPCQVSHHITLQQQQTKKAPAPVDPSPLHQCVFSFGAAFPKVNHHGGQSR